jgi:hypothetical protein
MKRVQALLVLCFSALLFSATFAHAQNYVYSFYDGTGGTGNLIATYTGPLLTPQTSGTINGWSWNMPCYNNYGATLVLPPIYYFNCWNPSAPYGNPQVSLFWEFPQGEGTYDLGNQFSSNDFFEFAQGVFQRPQSVVVVAVVTPTYSCTGFQPPFDIALSLNKKTNRAIPLKAQLFDSSNNLVTPTTLGAAPPPVVNVSYQSGTSPAVDDTSLLDPLGQSSSGNQFNFDTTANNWWFNLSSTPFTASGTYTVTLQSGDTTQYQVSPQCTGTFVRQ